jgi:hypothetical protein
MELQEEQVDMVLLFLLDSWDSWDGILLFLKLKQIIITKRGFDYKRSNKVSLLSIFRDYNENNKIY